MSEKKPEKVLLRLVDQENHQQEFKVSKKTKVSKIIENFARVFEKKPADLVLMFEGEQLQSGSRVEDFIDDEDSYQIDVKYIDSKKNKIEVVIKDSTGIEMKMIVKKSITFQKVLDTFCKNKNVDLGSRMATYDGNRIDLDTTLESVEMKDGGVIDLFARQIGG